VLSLDAKPGPIYDACQRGGVDDPRKLVSPLLQWALTEIRAECDKARPRRARLCAQGGKIAMYVRAKHGRLAVDQQGHELHSRFAR
jgi:hypothetical protein